MTMTEPRSQTIGKKLLDEAFMFLRLNQTPTEFEMRRMDRDARILYSVDPELSTFARAALAAIRWDMDDLEIQVRSILELDPSPTSAYNAGVLYRMVNNEPRGVEMMLKAWKAAPKNETFATGYFASLLGAGMLEEAHRVSEKFVLPESERAQAVMLARTVEDLTDLKITENDVVSQLRIAQEVMSEQRARIQDTRFGIQADPDGGFSSLLVMLEFIGNVEQEALFAEETAARSIDLPNWNPAKIALWFIPHESKINELHAT